MVGNRAGPVRAVFPVIWGSVPQRNKNFTGREALLDKLRERVLRKDTAAVLPHAMHGMGGVGKTQLAVEYAYRYARDYEVVWWISADQPGLIRSTLAGLAPRLGLTGLAPGRVEDAVSAVLDALRRGKPKDRWLLIFDNADQPEQIRSFMPSGPGHVIVTSRNRRWDQVADAIEVDVFSREESQKFLDRRDPGIAARDADRLAEALGDLPLALEQAASLLTETVMTPKTYLDLLEEQASRVLGERPSTTDYPLPVAAAWSVSVTKLRAQTPSAMELLQRCAFFGAAPIPLELLERGRYVLGPPMQETLRDPILMGRAVRALGRYSLARIDNYRRTLQVHRVIQILLREELPEKDQYKLRHEVHLLMAAADPGDPDTIENWPKYEELLAHLGPSEAVTCRTKEVRQLTQNIVRYLYITGNYTAALESANHALTRWIDDSDKKDPGENDSHVLIMSRLKAQVLRGLARYKESYDMTANIMPHMQRVLGEDHEETLILMNGHCVDLRARGEFKASQEFTEKTLERHRAVFGIEHPRTFVAMNNLAEDLELNGNYTSARELNQQIYDEKRIFYGHDDHPTVLYALNALARTLREQGNYSEALEMAAQAYAGYQELVQTKVLAEGHPWVLGCAVDLAVARRAAGAITQSLELAQDAYDRYRRAFGADHTATLAAAICLGNAQREAGEFKHAETLLEDTLRRYRSVLGSDHPYTLSCAVDLAIAKRHQGDSDSARRLLADAREGLTDRLGAEHHCSLACTADLATTLAELGEAKQAAELEKEALPRFQTALGPDHPSTLACMANLSLNLKALGQDQQAAEQATAALKRLRRALGSEHPNVQAATEGHRLDIDIDPTATF